MHIFYRSLFWLYYWHSSPSWVSLAAHATIDSRARMVSSTNSSKDRLVVCCVSGKLVLSEMRQAHAHEKPFSSTRVCFAFCAPAFGSHRASTSNQGLVSGFGRGYGICKDDASWSTSRPRQNESPGKGNKVPSFSFSKIWMSKSTCAGWLNKPCPSMDRPRKFVRCRRVNQHKGAFFRDLYIGKLSLVYFAQFLREFHLHGCHAIRVPGRNR